MGHASSRAVEWLLEKLYTSDTYETSCGIREYDWNGTSSDFVLYGAEVLLKYNGNCDDSYDKSFLTIHNVDCPHCLAWLDFAFEVKDL